MIYRPIESRKLWDTWLFPWKGQFHLFFLETQETNNDHVGHAISSDLVHWQTLQSIHTTGVPGQWNHPSTLTGMVVRHEGRFYLFVGAYPEGKEVYGAYISDDLEHWKPHPDNPILQPADPYYLTDPARAPYRPVDWRDPCIVWREEDQHYHAILCARLPKWNHEDTGAAVAHVRSKDLIHWEYLPPLATLGKRFFNTEVPDIFELNGRYYLTFCTSSLGGININTPSRYATVGAFYMVGSSYEGPFILPKDPLLVGAGHRKNGAYSARTIAYQGGRLLYHHTAAKKRPAWGAPKTVRTCEDGKLWLEYLPVLEKLETGIICNSVHDIPYCNTSDLGCWNQNNGRLIGKALAMGTACKVACDVADLHIQCRISASSAACAGIVLRCSKDKQGMSVLLDFENQWIQIGPAIGRDVVVNSLGAFASCQSTIKDTYRCQLKREKNYHLRCFARDEFFEVYIDDRWVFTTGLPEISKNGDVELYVERGQAEFTDLRLASIEPLA